MNEWLFKFQSLILIRIWVTVGGKCTKILNCLLCDFILLIALKQINILYVIFCNIYSYPYEVIALWYITLQLILSSDVHPNPGPLQANSCFNNGFFSFCNWNLNTLSKDDFYRVSLLEAHNSSYNYDIISLCETSLNDTIEIRDDMLPGYKFYPWNHPDGNRSAGVGIFYKESLPLRVRPDLSFNECLVSELIFGRKKIFFTVLYRNPENKANSVQFATLR